MFSRIFNTVLFVLSGLIFLTAGSPAAKEAGSHSWGYDGAAAPAQWGMAYPMCGQGMIQSPIDLTGAFPANLPEIDFTYGKSRLHMTNNGHTIQADVEAGHSISINGMTYQLVQFHFHATSEHTLNGKYLPMEVHFVHKAENGAIAVVGAFFDKGKSSDAWALVFGAFPAQPGRESAIDSPVDLMALLPTKRSYYGYTGSLTTPPCTEGVAWYVFDTIVELSPEQIDAFRAIYDHNFRPVNPKNGRLLMGSGKP